MESSITLIEKSIILKVLRAMLLFFKSSQKMIVCEQKWPWILIFSFPLLTLFYTGFFLYVKIRGGVFLTPPWLKLEKWLKLGKRHFLAKIDYCCPLFMHLKLNYYHFWLKKGQKNLKATGFEPRHRRVPPLDCMWKKLST